MKTAQCTIEFLNKDKGFKPDTIEFNSYPDALRWGKDNIENFTFDHIKWRRTCNADTGTNDPIKTSVNN